MFLALLAVVFTALLLYKFFLSQPKTPDWWQKYGVREIDVTHIASNLEVLLGTKNITLRDDYAYEKTDKFSGMVEKPCPVILVKDLDLLKKILIKDSLENFVDRRDFFTIANKKSISAKMLGVLKGDEWKGVRASVSPTFTTGKIRRMMEHFNSVGKEWTDMLKTKANNTSGGLKLNMMKVANQYTIEVIATSVFGVHTGTVENADSIFSKMAYRIAEFTPIQAVKLNLSPRYPALFKFLGIEALDQEALGFFEAIVRQGLDTRLKGEVRRNDFQQLLIDARKGELKAMGSDELSTFEKEALIKESNDRSKYLTDDSIVAQSVVFFLAGFLGTSALITNVAYALAVHQDIQKRLREEVDPMIKEDGTIDYDDLGKLVYLDMVINETLRKYPVALRLERECLKDYHDPESGLQCPKGSVLVAPVMAIHNDKKYYDNPDKFDPEHFSQENKAKRSPYAYMPFGHGPRNCIGMRFALIESKAAIALLIRNFQIDPTDKTPTPMFNRRIGIQMMPPKNLELKLTPVKH